MTVLVAAPTIVELPMKVQLTRKSLQHGVFESLYLSPDDNYRHYIVDFSRVDEIDDANVFWLNQFVERAKRRGQRVKLVNLNTRIWLRCLEVVAETNYYRYG